MLIAKKCPVCKIEKSLNDFYKSKPRKDGYQLYCKICQNKKVKDSFNKNRETKVITHRKRVQKIAKRNNKEIYDYLVKHSCADCNEKDPVVLQFDHIDPSTKHSNISDMHYCSLEKLFNEIKKCRILCANCHLVRTAEYRKYYSWTRSRGLLLE